MPNTVNLESLSPQLDNKAVIAAFANLQIEALKLQCLSLVGMAIYELFYATHCLVHILLQLVNKMPTQLQHCKRPPRRWLLVKILVIHWASYCWQVVHPSVLEVSSKVEWPLQIQTLMRSVRQRELRRLQRRCSLASSTACSTHI